MKDMENTSIINGRRIASDRIAELGENEIFVFGSNIHGAHGGGAARYAHQKFGAEWGVGEGLTGRTYALPTMEGDASLKQAVEHFIACAKAHPEFTFLVTAASRAIPPMRWLLFSGKLLLWRTSISPSCFGKCCEESSLTAQTDRLEG